MWGNLAAATDFTQGKIVKNTAFCSEKYLKAVNARGGSRSFFRRGCTRLLLHLNNIIPHSFWFFLRNTSCIRKPQVISGRGGGVRTLCTLPLAPPLNAEVNRRLSFFFKYHLFPFSSPSFIFYFSILFFVLLCCCCFFNFLHLSGVVLRVAISILRSPSSLISTFSRCTSLKLNVISRTG